MLKRFLRKLPAPLLTAEYLPAFASVPSACGSGVRVQERMGGWEPLALVEQVQKGSGRQTCSEMSVLWGP